MQIEFEPSALPREGALVVGATEGGALTATAAEIDRKLGGAIGRAVAGSRFKGKAQQTLDLIAPAGLEAERVLLVGLGKPQELHARAAEAIGGAIYGHLAGSGQRAAAVAVDEIESAVMPAAQAAAHIALGARLASYRFDRYRTKQEADEKPSLERLTLMLDDPGAGRGAWRPLEAVADGVFLARDLVSEPPNVLYPETLAEAARRLGALGVEVEVLGRRRMEELGMGAMLGVAQGSAREPFVVSMEWRGAGGRGAARRPVAFVGKGVTFDSGGISIKPAGGMEDMKWDMGGAGAVIGLMRALAGRKAKVNAVGVIGAVENMPSGTAQRPGDVVRSMSGQTIEVINTDAEGRLVLADVLWHTQQRFKPRAIVDLATLTGAIIVALGHHNAGLFSNDDALAEQLLAAGKEAGEPVWRMPLGEDYDKQIKSEIADMKNVGGREGGSITGAQFIQRFVKDTPWAHLDIAGVAWSSKGKPTAPKGATGFGVRLLDRFVTANYEG